MLVFTWLFEGYMADKPWKQFERPASAIFGGKRFPANVGDRLDFTSESTQGQCKHVASMSLEAITKLAEEMESLAPPDKRGVVCLKVRRGSGRQSPVLVVMTEREYLKDPIRGVPTTSEVRLNEGDIVIWYRP